MSLSALDLALYAGAVFVLFMTPGPVWMALVARAMSGGFQAAWPLTLGVVVGDMAWPLLAILGVSWIAQSSEIIAVVLKGVAVVMFVTMGAMTMKNADKPIASDSRLTRPGKWAGFLAGVIVILSNPKAVLFYMGLLPGFFDLSAVTGWDIAAIVFVSQIVPLIGNLGLAAFVDRIRRLLSSPGSVARMNRFSGAMLIGVGLIIPFT